ncbi:MAG: hypothetical protein JW982_14455 [Spirochaetes bacterium]|nr:hypothetical protein [Spirochaetota bacterium]
MTYIIGVDHLIQYNNGIVPEDIFREFTDYLNEQTQMFNINLIAEEFSEFVKNYGCDDFSHNRLQSLIHYGIEMIQKHLVLFS